jgi:hypothetical protein
LEGRNCRGKIREDGWKVRKGQSWPRVVNDLFATTDAANFYESLCSFVFGIGQFVFLSSANAV